MRKPQHLPGVFPVWAFLGVFLMQASCGTNHTITDPAKLTKVVEMKKGPCFGRCPVFTLTIYDNGLATYEGERFTDKLGTYVKKLSENQYDNVRKAFEQANLWQYKDFYKGRIPDLATVTISYYEKDRSKTITGKDGRPDVLLELEEMLDDIAGSEGWELKDRPPSDLPEEIIADELIVQLVQGVDATAWARKYAKQRMELVRSLSPNGYYWLFRFDKELMDPKEMLGFVRNDADVVSAEFNKRLGGRN